MKRRTLIAAAGLATGALIGAEYYLRYRNRMINRDRWFHESYDGSQPYQVFHNRSGWELMPDYNVAGIRINQYGFRGEDFSRSKDADVKRIICLGDSTTFGLAGDESPYPYHLQQHLGDMELQSPYQVINAGVEGHSSVNGLLRLPWLITHKPDIMIIYLGWSDLWISNPGRYPDLRRKPRSFWHYGNGHHSSLMMLDTVKDALGFNGYDPPISSFDLDTFVPTNFEFNMKQIIRTCKKEQVRTVLVTLPTLIPSCVDQSSLGKEMLEKLRYPAFFSPGDLDSLKQLYEVYDTTIRTLAYEEDVDLVDINDGFEAFDNRRDQYFLDTSHPNIDGNQLIAQILANGLYDRGIVG